MHDSVKTLRAVTWSPVPDFELTQRRYKRICRVSAYKKGRIASTGLGWAVNATTVATAAHLLSGTQFKADKCELEWIIAGSGSTSTTWSIPEAYVSPTGARRKGSSFDIASITIDALPPAQAQVPAPHGKLEFVSWRDDRLLRALSPFIEVLPFLGHFAPTIPGDSGGPVFMGDRVVGMVLGTAALSQSYLSDEDAARFQASGSALAITPKSLAFLST